jgi:hypothetical protein
VKDGFAEELDLTADADFLQYFVLTLEKKDPVLSKIVIDSHPVVKGYQLTEHPHEK